jgi:hypothetical protein
MGLHGCIPAPGSMLGSHSLRGPIPRPGASRVAKEGKPDISRANKTGHLAVLITLPEILPEILLLAQSRNVPFSAKKECPFCPELGPDARFVGSYLMWTSLRGASSELRKGFPRSGRFWATSP